MTRTLTTVFAVAALVVVHAQGEYMSFCDVVKDPARYDKRSLITSGVFASGPESSEFYDSACDHVDGRAATGALVPVSDSVAKTRGWKKVEAIVTSHKLAFVVVHGYFDNGRPFEGKLPDNNPELRRVLETYRGGFGHQNANRFRLRVTEVEIVLPAATEPTP